MKITCDKCGTRIELDRDPGQPQTTTCRCARCDAMLDVPVVTVEAMADDTAKSRRDTPSPKTSNKKMDFLRTDMPGKKRKKRNVSESLKAEPAPRGEASQKRSAPAGSEADRMKAAPLQPGAGGLLDQDDPFDFLADEEEKAMAGDMLNEKTEVLSIDDFELNPGKEASMGKADPGTGGPAGEGNLFLDFDLEGLGLDEDVLRRISNADEGDDLEGMKPFTLDLEDEFSTVSEDETIVLDLDLDGRSEKFRPVGEKKPPDAVSKVAAAGARDGFPAEAPAAVSAAMDGRFGAAGKDGLLDLFLDLDQGQNSSASRGKAFAEEAGLLKMENGDFIVEGEDPENLPLDLRSLKKELDARDAVDGQEDFLELDLGLDDQDSASASGDVGLGLDENLLMDLDLDFDDEEEAAAPGSPGAASGDPELERDENLFLDLDLDLDFEEIDGGAPSARDRGEVLRERGSAMAPSSEEDLLDDLDLDFEEDEQGLATIVADGGLNREVDGGASSRIADLGLDEDLLLDLDLDDEEEMAAQEEAELQGESIAPMFDPGQGNSQTAASALREEEFSLDLDLDDGSEEAPLSDAEEDAVLVDLELTPEPDAGAASAASVRKGEEEFSLELDLDLDDGPEEAALLSDADEEGPVVDLELTPEPDAGAASTASAGEGEEEFSLELDLNLEDGPEEAAPLSDADDEGPVVDLELTPELDAGAASTASAGEGEEEFSLELDLDLEDGPEEAALLSNADEEGPQGDPEKAPSLNEDISLELALDDGAELVSGTEAVHAEVPAADADEILKAVDGDAESDEDFLFNMELEKFEEAPDALETAPVAEHVDADDGAEPDGKSTFQHEPESFEVVEEILLSSDHELKAREAGQREEDFIDAFDMGIPTNEFEELNENPPENKKPQSAPVAALAGGALISAGASRGRRRFGVSAWILVMALLGALLFGAYSFGLFEGANATNILRRIPFLREYIGVADNPAGEVIALRETIKERFVENKIAGTLFVITGKVRNDAPGSRSHIEVIGTMSAPGKKNAGKEVVYCGNTLTDEELTTLPPDRIKAILTRKAGNNNSNVNVPSGKVVPYMIVFDHPPATLEGYSVMVKESMTSGG